MMCYFCGIDRKVQTFTHYVCEIKNMCNQIISMFNGINDRKEINTYTKREGQDAKIVIHSK